MDIRELDSTTLMWLAAALAVLFLLLGLKLSQWWASWQSRGRNRVARAGEIDAERMLARAGFRVVARQQPARWTMSIDGDVVEVAVRADLIVERKGKRYVAEVKTGGRAPDPCLPSTRRQLLEYCFVFQTSSVLLVDVPAQQIHSVSFPEVFSST